MKRPETAKGKNGGYYEFFGEHEDKVKRTLANLQEARVVQRIWEHDHTVWKSDPDEISNRLGWLNSPKFMADTIPRLADFTQHARDEGFDNAVLLGMGGSSLAPDLFSKVFGSADGYLEVRVLDSTDPGAVREITDSIDPGSTLFVVSTKSGTTAETLSFFKHFFNLTEKSVGVKMAGRHFAAITDPGSPLVEIAEKLAFRDIFLNDPDIGGRYSALSFFGLVPAGLMGMDLARLLDEASSMAGKCGSPDYQTDGDDPGTRLGAALGYFALSGRDKLTFVASAGIEAFGAWAEQLLAESTGKEGKGILPVDGERPGDLQNYGTDRLFVHLRLDGDDSRDSFIQGLIDSGQPVIRIDIGEKYNLGREFFRWEMATAIAGHVLGINPFDQPNVESAKDQARRMLDAYIRKGSLPEQEPTITDSGVSAFTDLSAGSVKEVLEKFLDQAEPGDYAALQAYVKPSGETWELLQNLRLRIRDKYRIATTLGYGPRFLHSTGQLHKGDAGRGLFVQITSTPAQDLSIPDEPGDQKSSMTFGVLKTAQAMGDRQALLDAGRKVIRLELGTDLTSGLRRLGGMIS